MDKPTIELIRFDASDVIATSGHDGTHLGDPIGSGKYVIFRQEWAQAYPTYFTSNNSSIQWVTIRDNSIYSLYGADLSQFPFDEFKYAWYNSQYGWCTDEKTLNDPSYGVTDYSDPLNGSNLPY